VVWFELYQSVQNGGFFKVIEPVALTIDIAGATNEKNVVVCARP
jgi:hypothetical protein